MTRRSSFGYLANVAAAAAMSATPHVDSAVVANSSAPAPVMPAFTTGTAPTTPAPQQPTQARSERVVEVGQVKFVENDKGNYTKVSGYTYDVGQRLNQAIKGEPRDGHRRIDINRRAHLDNPGRTAIDRKAETDEGDKFIRIRNVRISTDPNLGEPVNIDTLLLNAKGNAKLKEWNKADLDKEKEAGMELRVLTRVVSVLPKQSKKTVAKLKREGRYKTPRSKKRRIKEYFVYVDPKFVSAYVRDLIAKIDTIKAKIAEAEANLSRTSDPKRISTLKWHIDQYTAELEPIQAEREAINYTPQDHPDYLASVERAIVDVNTQISKETARLDNTNDINTRRNIKSRLDQLDAELVGLQSTIEAATFVQPEELEDPETGGKVVRFDNQYLRNTRVILGILRTKHAGKRKYKDVRQRGGTRELHDYMTDVEAIELDEIDRARLFTNQAVAFDYDWVSDLMADLDPGVVDWEEIDGIALDDYLTRMDELDEAAKEELKAMPSFDDLRKAKYRDEKSGANGTPQNTGYGIKEAIAGQLPMIANYGGNPELPTTPR